MNILILLSTLFVVCPTVKPLEPTPAIVATVCPCGCIDCTCGPDCPCLQKEVKKDKKPREHSLKKKLEDRKKNKHKDKKPRKHKKAEINIYITADWLQD